MREAGYILTKLGKTTGYIGKIAEKDIDDTLRATFTTLRRETIPVTPSYIWQLTRQPSKGITKALRLLEKAGLVRKLK